MVTHVYTPFLVGLCVLLTACGNAQLPIQKSLPPPAYTQTGWQVETSPISAHKHEFIKQVSERYHIPEHYIDNMLSRATINPRVAHLMSPKKTTRLKKHWQTYRRRFVEPIRIRNGTAFWNTHRSSLAAAEKIYGVPAAIIVSIIGVETLYGKYMGNFNILDALYTLGFHHPDTTRPEKAQMFRNQLAALIELNHKGKFEGTTAMGSFAGASGLGQFMPISLLHYAVSAHSQEKIDLRNNTTDAIYSIANFLLKHGWQANMPVFAPVQLPNYPDTLVDGGLEANTSWTQLQQQGARSSVQHQPWQKGKRLGVIDLRDDVRGFHQYRTATQNFFAITKYNRSYFYAAAVSDLATQLAKKQIALGHKVRLP